jgi:hypothetical protein
MVNVPPLVDGIFQYDDDDGLKTLWHTRATPKDIERIIVEHGKYFGDTTINGKPVRRSWWEAQVHLYGLKCPGYSSSWNIANMVKALSNALKSPGGLQVSPEVQEVELRSKRRYPEYKKRYIEDEPKRLAAQKERERINAALQHASKPTASKPAIQETRTPVPVVAAEPKEDGEPMETDTSDDASSDDDSSDDDSSVQGPIDKTDTETSLAARDEQLRTMIKLHDQLLKDEGPGKNIAGTWHLDCPHLTLKYCKDKVHQHQKIIWNIHSEVDDNYPSFGWIKFDMIVVEGVIRVQALEFPNKCEGKKLPFTWRGRKTADWELLCNDDVNLGYVIFPSMHECWGSFSVFGQTWPFMGKKVDKMIPSKSLLALREEYKHYLDCLKRKGFNRASFVNPGFY